MLTSSSGKEKENINIACVTCLMFKKVTIRKNTGDLSIDFHRTIATREAELTNKTAPGENQV